MGLKEDINGSLLNYSCYVTHVTLNPEKSSTPKAANRGEAGGCVVTCAQRESYSASGVHSFVACSLSPSGTADYFWQFLCDPSSRDGSVLAVVRPAAGVDNGC